MKVIQINSVYDKGSTGKITADLHRELLKNGVNSNVLYGRGNKTNEKGVTKVCGEFYSHINKIWSMITGLMYGGCFFSTNKIIKIIKKEKPDVVHLQCINGYFLNIYRLIKWLNKNKIKTVLTLHAEFMFTANCGYSFDCEKWKTGCNHCSRFKKETKSLLFDKTKKSWNKMSRAFKGFDTLTVTSVSPWLMERAKMSSFFSDKQHYVTMNGLNDEIFHYSPNKELNIGLGLEGKKTIFFASPTFNYDPNHIKGGYYVIELAKRLPEIMFVVAAPYKEGICVPNNIILLGKISDQKELASLYSNADLTLLVSKKETFSMVTAESLCCGTPVVGFKAGGPESIAISDFSKFIEYGNIDLLEQVVKELLTEEFNKEKISKISIGKYSKNNMFESFICLYNKLSG